MRGGPEGIRQRVGVRLALRLFLELRSQLVHFAYPADVAIFLPFSPFFRLFFDSISAIDFDAFFDGFCSQNEAQNRQKINFLETSGALVFEVVFWMVFWMVFACENLQKPYKKQWF